MSCVAGKPDPLGEKTVETKIAVFHGSKIRRVMHNNEWWFSVVDSQDARAYWLKLKQRLNGEGNQVVINCHGLKLPATDGKMRETDCANTVGLLRIIQSIPSPKAEPFKRWLVKVGYDRVRKIGCFNKIFNIQETQKINQIITKERL